MEDLLIFSELLWEDTHGENEDQLDNVVQSEEGEGYCWGSRSSHN